MARKPILPKSHHDRLLPLVARAFAELGYRRATTAELARRCRVRENVLYRVWPSKRDMFLASIAYVSDSSLQTWRDLLAQSGKESPAQRVLEYESIHHGEFGLYRIVFAGLSESDDPEIREALRQMYLRFHEFVSAQLSDTGSDAADAQLAAWALVGIGTISNISRELGLMSDTRRQALFRRAGNLIMASHGR